LSILISPGLLREWRIEFTITKQSVGEMMVTVPGAYHQVFNAGQNCAVSINFEEDSSPDVPEDYKWCTQGPESRGHCGEYVLTEEQFKLPNGDKDTIRLEPGNKGVTHAMMTHQSPCPKVRNPQVPNPKTPNVKIPNLEIPRSQKPNTSPKTTIMRRFYHTPPRLLCL
jgi:hypothetical protein